MYREKNAMNTISGMMAQKTTPMSGSEMKHRRTITTRMKRVPLTNMEMFVLSVS